MVELVKLAILATPFAVIFDMASSFDKGVSLGIEK